VANGPNIFQMLLVLKLNTVKKDADAAVIHKSRFPFKASQMVM